jgi:hypothetical protein
MSTRKSPISLSQYILDQIPQTDSALTALNLAFETLPEAILNHSIRVFLLVRWLAEKEGSEWAADEEKRTLLFVAAICHDFGASDLYNGSQRFEVEGADAAEAHCLSHGIAQADAHKVWTAIALHTSPGIAERIDPFTRLIRLAVKMDFSAGSREQFQATQYSEEIEQYLPRLDIERVLANAVVKQAVKIPERVDSMTWPDSQKHPKQSWPGILLRAHIENPGYDGVNPAF